MLLSIFVVCIGDGGECVYFRDLWDGEGLADSFGCLFSCGNDGLAMRELAEQGMDVGWFYDFKKLV